MKQEMGTNTICAVLYQILLGLRVLHKRHILHRDIKPQNILLWQEDGQFILKLSDLGMSKQMGSTDEYASTRVGTLMYMSPECISRLPYNQKSDVYSVGVILFELLFKALPFTATTVEEIAHQIKL